MDYINYLTEINDNLRVLTFLDDFLIIATLCSVLLTIIFVSFITINYKTVLRMSVGKTKIVHGMTLILALISGILSLSSFYSNYKTMKQRKIIDNIIDNINDYKFQNLENDIMMTKKDGDTILNIKLTKSNTIQTKDGKTVILVDTNKIVLKNETNMKPHEEKMETFIQVQKELKKMN